jgi:hypothetical protein
MHVNVIMKSPTFYNSKNFSAGGMPQGVNYLLSKCPLGNHKTLVQTPVLSNFLKNYCNTIVVILPTT